MLNGTATPVRLKRPNLRSGAAEYFLPAGLGVFFRTCWTGKETAQHHIEGEVCPNCGRDTPSDRLVSLHAIDHRKQWTTAHVIALDHRWTYLVARAIQSKDMLVRPLVLEIGPGDNVSLTSAVDGNIHPADMRKAADRIVSIWQHHFRGRLSITPDMLSVGTAWIE